MRHLLQSQGADSDIFIETWLLTQFYHTFIKTQVWSVVWTQSHDLRIFCIFILVVVDLSFKNRNRVLSPQAFPFSGASRLSRIKCIFSHWGHITQSSAIYVSDVGNGGEGVGSDQPVYAAWLVAQLQWSARGLFSWDCWSSYGGHTPLQLLQSSLIPPWGP